MSTASAVRRAAVVVGNPNPSSRTSAAALAIATRMLREMGADGTVTVIELSDLAAKLFVWGDADVAEAKATVLASDLLVVASPVYKASYTGLLKAFIDQFGRDELAAIATVPVMVGASPLHALAVEHQLRPVLIEIGAACPTRGLFLLENQLEDLDTLLTEWFGIWGDVLQRCITPS